VAQSRILRTADAVREIVSAARAAERSIAFVPTMGNLHAGHMSLAALAATLCDEVLLSIFVNPTQFGPNEDFGAYPRTFDADLAQIEAAGNIAAVFVPEVGEIYPFGPENAVRVVLPPLAGELCGASRPGHFDGVASVVCRLLNIVMPDVVVLGQKDYQQVVLLQRMVTDLRMPVRVTVGATKREPDGLAMSSRNRYLTTEQREHAPALHRALAAVCDGLRAGRTDHAALTATAVEQLRAAGFRPDYVEIRRAADLAHAQRSDVPADLVVLGAGWLGRARLIDNLLVERGRAAQTRV
jgi:pantoate--beta-alanine ligase